MPERIYMDFFELMNKRTSSRKFTDEPLTEAEINKILEAGTLAPVGSNRYNNLHLTVVTDKELLKTLAEASQIRRSNTKEMAEIINNVSNAGEILEQANSYDPFYDAAAVIFVSHKKQDLEPNIQWCNATSVILAMHLATVEMGLGSCYMWFALDSMRRIPELDHTDLLHLPEDFEPLLGLAVGHVEKPLEERNLDSRRIGRTFL